jgi:hypothetical protein
MFFNARVEFAKKGQDLVPQSVTGEGGIMIARIFHPRQPVLLQIRKNLPPGDFQQGADERAFLQPHASKPGGAAAAQQSVQNRFRLIAAMMPERYRPATAVARRLPQEVATHRPRGFFNAQTTISRFIGYIAASDRQGDAPAGTQVADKIRLPATFRPKTMIQMRRVQGEREFGGEFVQQMEEADRVGATGDGDQHPVSGVQ